MSRDRVAVEHHAGSIVGVTLTTNTDLLLLPRVMDHNTSSQAISESNARNRQVTLKPEYVNDEEYAQMCMVHEMSESASAARPANECIVVNSNERRRADDGEWYTLQEFIGYFGVTGGPAIWQVSAGQDRSEQCLTAAAPKVKAVPKPKKAPPPHTTAVLPIPNVGASIRDDSGHSQAIVTTMGHGQCQQGRSAWDQLDSMPSLSGCGGKAANGEQKRLRAQCFGTGTWEIDLTDCSEYDWRQLLKAIPEPTSRKLVGTGVAKFSFRLLQTVRDPNYCKIDTGERHVFEIAVTDGDRWQLHFHKNGKMDEPTWIPPTAVLHSQPFTNAIGEEEWHWQHILLNHPKDNLPVGRQETSIALARILHSYSPQETPFAVDITATSAFPWDRMLRNVMLNRQIIGIGIVKVFALCPTSNPHTHPWQNAQIVFCRPDDTYTIVKPESKSDGESQLVGWRDCQTYSRAPVQTGSWMQIRAIQP